MSKPLVIFGDGPFAEIAHEYFTHDSNYEVVAFTVNQTYLKRPQLFDLPVVPFESLNQSHPPDKHEMFIALTYTDLNALRRRFYEEAKARGYQLASYVSSRAFVWRNVEMGDNCFIFENNVLQPFVKLGSNNILWSGNHIGHHSTIGSHCFLSSHVVMSGFVTLGDGCFVGVNATFSDHLEVGENSLIGAAAFVSRNVVARSLVRGQPSLSTERAKTKS